MTTPIRAVFENGYLKPLESLDLTEGQEVDFVILSDRERAIAALGDLVVQAVSIDDEEIDEEALQREIDEALRGKPSVSDAIIEERREGP